MGLVTMFNGMDVLQTRHYVKVYAQTYIECSSAKHLQTWMNVSQMPNQPTPLPVSDNFIKAFLAADGPRLDDGTPDIKAIEALAKKHQLGYRNGIGELIWAYITCRPDVAYAVVRSSQ